MTLKQWFKQEYKNKVLTKDTFIEVKRSNGKTVGYMSMEDMIDSAPEYLKSEYGSSEKKDDGSYVVTLK